ncbi:pyridoxal phosphate-dependent aminotransferase [Nocardia sp. NPDC057668]|uniref:pyridoxal phosphate-dependent aminotransferase n=1 Tax=Nocardia sp. NPDC057668 TaxID=3346202 RepID=UPI003670DECF
MIEPTAALSAVDPLAAEFSGARPRFPGADRRAYQGVIDAYHGETGLPLDPRAAQALDTAWHEVRTGTQGADYRDRDLYDKHQPLILRNLAADRLFQRLRAPGGDLPGVRVDPGEVIVCPYSSTVLLEEAVATLARPGGVLVCPEGYYKNAESHVAKYGMRLVSSPSTADDRFAIDPDALARCLEQHARQGNLCGVLLTLPGNPVLTEYTVEELTAIGRVLTASRVPVICDMSFDLLSAAHVPIAALTVPTPGGPVRLYDRVLTITGNSKAFNAFGPCKLGAACTGDSAWLARIEARLRVSFQRESTHLTRAVLEHTTPEYLAANRDRLRRRVEHARDLVAGINVRAGSTVLRPLGSSDGMFLTVEFAPGPQLSARARTSAELERLLLTEAGIECVALDRTGSSRLGVRFNVVAPRLGPGLESPALLDELFDRLEGLLQRVGAVPVRGNAVPEHRIPVLAS